MIKITQIKNREGHDPVQITLLAGKVYTVGRKNCDIIFPDDQSVSRIHGEISVDHPLANVTNDTLIPTVTVTDLGSKFGTFANKVAIPLREASMLSPDDLLRFGSQWNEFKIEYTPLVVTSSTLENNVELKQVLQKLGGHLAGEWKEKCDYVVMKQTTLTIKVVCCILSAKRLVTPAYFQDLLSALETKKSTLPKPQNYFPPIVEKSLANESISFEPITRRKSIFRGKLFLFESMKHVKKLGIAVKCGGGETGLILSVSQSALKDKNTIIVGIASELMMIDDQFKAAVEIYQSAQKRVIKESEIGLAGLFASMEQNCNPFVETSTNLKNRLGSQTQQPSLTSASASSVIVCPESQSQSEKVSQRMFHTQSQSNRSVINETFVEPRPVGPSSTKPMQFDVPSMYIKAELPDAPLLVDPRGMPISSSKRGVDKDVEEGPSGNKRRLASVTPPEPSSKRQRQTTPNQSISQLSIAEEQKKKNKTLATLFGMSDSDDDDDSTPASFNSQKSVIPDSQASASQPRMTRTRVQAQRNGNTQASVSIFDSSYQETQVSVIEDDEDVVPGSPELFPESESEPTPKKKPGKADSSTKRKQPDEVILDSQEPGTSTKKRRVEENVPEQKVIPTPENLPIKEEKKLDNTDRYFWSVKDEIVREEDIKPLRFTFAKLLISKTDQPVIPAMENIGGRHVKNFKTFRKVVPLSQNSTIQNNSVNLDSATVNTNASTTSVRSDRTFSFRPFRGPKLSELNELVTTIEDEVRKTVRNKRQRINSGNPVEPSPVEIPAEQDEEDEFSFYQRPKTRATRASPTKSPQKSSRVTRSSPVKQAVPTSTRVTRSSPTKSTRSATQSSQRTASSRSNTPDTELQQASVATRSTRSTRSKAAPPPVITIAEDDDEVVEADDDEWSFK